MSLLDVLLTGIRSVWYNGVTYPREPQLAFTGAGVASVTDSSSTGQTIVNIPAAAAPPAPRAFVVIGAGTTTVNPQVDTDYATELGGAATIILASTIPDGTRVGIFDAQQQWATYNVTIQDQGGYLIRVPYNIGQSDVASLVMGLAPVDTLNGQSVSIKKFAALSKWLY